MLDILCDNILKRVSVSDVQEEHLRLLSERVERRLVEIVVSRFMHLDLRFRSVVYLLRDVVVMYVPPSFPCDEPHINTQHRYALKLFRNYPNQV